MFIDYVKNWFSKKIKVKLFKIIRKKVNNKDNYSYLRYKCNLIFARTTAAILILLNKSNVKVNVKVKGKCYK